MAIIDFYRVEHIHSGLGPYQAAGEVFSEDDFYLDYDPHPGPLGEGLIDYHFDGESKFGFVTPSQLLAWMDVKSPDSEKSIFDRLHERRSGQFVVKHYLIDSNMFKASRTQAICHKSQLKDAVKTYTIPEFVKRFTGKDLTPCVPSSEVTKSTSAESTAISSTAKSSGLTSTSCEPPIRRRSRAATNGSRISGSSALDQALARLIERQGRDLREQYERLNRLYTFAASRLGKLSEDLSWSSGTVDSPPSTGTQSVASTEPWRLTGPSQKNSGPSSCRFEPTSIDRFASTSVTVAPRMEGTTEASALSLWTSAHGTRI